jgi:hypothetical protein
VMYNSTLDEQRLFMRTIYIPSDMVFSIKRNVAEISLRWACQLTNHESSFCFFCFMFFSLMIMYFLSTYSITCLTDPFSILVLHRGGMSYHPVVKHKFSFTADVLDLKARDETYILRNRR